MKLSALKPWIMANPRLREPVLALASAGKLGRAVLAPSHFLAHEGAVERARLAVVTEMAPRAAGGWALMLETLLGPLPSHELLIVTPSIAQWGERAFARMSSPWAQNLPRGFEKHWLTLQADRGAPALAAQLPRLGAVLGTLDHYLPFAAKLAESSGVPLWVYAIDDHSTTLPKETIAAALQRANRVYGISREMCDHVRERYGRSSDGDIPPLRTMPTLLPRVTLPKPRVIFSGLLYDYHREALTALGQRFGATAELILLHPAGVEPRYEPPAGWTVMPGKLGDIDRDLQTASLCLIILDRSDDPKDGMRVAFPTKTRDYAALGLPIATLASPRSCIARVIAAERFGVVTDRIDEFCDLVDALLRDPARRDELGVRGRAFAEKHLDDATVGAAFRADLWRNLRR